MRVSLRIGNCITACLLSCVASGVAAQAANYDAASGLLSLPAVKVGAAVYADVTLSDLGNYTFVLRSAVDQIPPGPGVVTYDGESGIVTIPAVRVGSATYTDVRLLHVGNWTFTLQAATELPAATQDQVNAFFAAQDALFATAVPASGTARFAHLDDCYLGDGRTRAYRVSDYDGLLQERRARDAFRVGRVTANIQVVAARSLTNGDGSSRQELDVEYDIQYADGTVARAEKETLISGSSAGSPGCANPQDSPQWRAYGNRQLVQTLVRPRVIRDERYSITTGAPVSGPVRYRREVQFVVTDPLANATYVIMTGPGPSATVGGVAQQFGMKLISPWLLRSAPELAGKGQNFLNWPDDDNFATCRTTGSGVPVPSIADCAGLGAQGSNWGWGFTTTPNMAADTNFQDQGWVAGGWYRFDVYNDDGWKTINGHVGRTPVATYYSQLEQLPYTFVEMAGAGINADKFPRISLGAVTPVELLNNVLSATPAPIGLSWNAPSALSDGRKFALSHVFEYFEGPKSGNAAGAYFPAYQSIDFDYPGSGATSVTGLQVNPKLADMANKAYANFTVDYGDRGFGVIRSRIVFLQ